MIEERVQYTRSFTWCYFRKNNGGVNHSKNQTQVNERIRAKEIRLIGQNGDQIGVKSKKKL